MIGYLSGIIKNKNLTNLIIDVNGVGYQVNCPNYILNKIKVGQKKELYIYTHVKEEELSLFGFENNDDKDVFLMLLSVAGIGAKTAMMILSYSLGSQKIIQAIQNADVDYFDAIKGIGKKSSQRIIIDLKSKIGGLKELELQEYEDGELKQALQGLGFENEEIKKAMSGINHNLTLEEKIRLALKK